MSQVSQRLTWIFGIALVIALMVIAFLLGRESTSGVPARQVAALEPPEETQLAQAEEEAPAIDESGGSVAEVVAYFAKVDSIQAGPTGISAEAYAQQLAGEASRGDKTGIDALETNLVLMESQLRDVTPPPVCKEYHELTLSTVADAKTLLQDLHRAFAGDGSNASVLATSAQAAKEKTKKLHQMRRAIEKRYGLRR